MDLYVLPNIVNTPMNTGFSKAISAAAVGFIYYDDGVTLVQNTGRFDIFLNLEAVNNATFTILPVLAGDRKNTKEEELGTISIMQVSQC
jgi:hypothetical protein